MFLNLDEFSLELEQVDRAIPNIEVKNVQMKHTLAKFAEKIMEEASKVEPAY